MHGDVADAVGLAVDVVHRAGRAGDAVFAGNQRLEVDPHSIERVFGARLAWVVGDEDLSEGGMLHHLAAPEADLVQDETFAGADGPAEAPAFPLDQRPRAGL